MQRLSWQAWPGVQVAVKPLPQQGSPVPPQPEQRPPEQTPAIEVGMPQIWPLPTQEPPKQQAPPPQVLPAQQGPPGVPQGLQKAVSPSQTRVGLVQVPW